MKARIMSNLFRSLLIALFAFNFGCVKENFETVPQPEYVSKWTANTKIAQVKSYYANAVENIRTLATNKGVPAGDIIIEGLVTSNDSCANFYKTVTIQDETGGIDIKINGSDLYITNGLKPGQKVVMRLNDLYIDNYKGVYQIGTLIIDNSERALSEINLDKLPLCLEKSGRRQTITPLETSIAEINANKLTFVQKFVKLNGVQFLEEGRALAVDGVTTNRTLVDADGNAIVLRTSGFAKFKETLAPSGSGSITGVLSIYGTTCQLSVRDLNDIKLDQPRMGGDAPAKTHTIAELRSMWTGGLVKIDQDVVIEGVLSADDEFGNVYQQMFINDGTDALEIKIDAGGLFAEFPVGTKIRLNCKGLTLGTSSGLLQVGGVYKSEVGRMPADDFYKRVRVVGTGVVEPIPTTVTGFSASMIGKLVKVSDVQFVRSALTKTWALPGVATNRTLNGTAGGSVLVRTSGYAKFITNRLPQGSGSLIGILTKFNTDYQLVVRDLRDVDMKLPRVGEEPMPTPNTTLAELRAMYTGTGFVQITTPTIIQGTIVANDVSGNLYKQLVIQDASGAMEFKVNRTGLAADYPVGQKVIINCKDLYLGSYGGVTQLGGTYNGGTSFGGIEPAVESSKVYWVEGGSIVEPKITSIANFSDADLMKLIQLDDVEFVDADLGKVYAAKGDNNRTLRDCGGATVIVRTNEKSKFANNVLPDKKGVLVGVLSKFNGTYQITLREKADVNFTLDRCQ